MIEELKQLLKDGLADLKSAGSSEHFEKWRIRYLGSKGALKGAMARLKEVAKEDKPRVGQLLNEIKATLEQEYEAAKAAAADVASGGSWIDVTEPGLRMGEGRRHILSRTVDEITEVFARMGYSIAQGPEVEDEWHNFIALNIPPNHPARDPNDNFYLRAAASTPRVPDGLNNPASPPRGLDVTDYPVNPPRGPGVTDNPASPPRGLGVTDNPPNQPRGRGGSLNASLLMLRSQTSTVQIRIMEKSRPPLRVIACGRVYRPDNHDATHFSMFHQVEGLYVDHNVSMVDLKTTLFQFAKAYFGEGADLRMTPSFFPFTEPSAEIAIKMQVGGQYKWVELGGCGMVDPNVFQAVGYDPEEWTGFAFGLGIERIAMRKYGVGDIRWLFENDARFLRQF